MFSFPFCFYYKIHASLLSAVLKCLSSLDLTLFVAVIFTKFHLKVWNISRASYTNKWTNGTNCEAGGCRTASAGCIHRGKALSGMCYRSC